MGLRSAVTMMTLVLLVAGGLEAQKLTVSCLNTNAPFAPVFDKLLAEAGYQVTVKVLPAERSYLMIKNGEIDAEFFRTDSSIEVDPDIVKVNVPLHHVEYRAYTARPDLRVRNRRDLTGLVVGYPRGNKTVEALTEGLNTYVGLDNARLFKMLELGRIDVLVVNQLTAAYILKLLYPDMVVYPQEPPLLVEDAYVVVARTRQDLVPGLAKVFRTWVETGRWQKELNALLVKKTGFFPPLGTEKRYEGSWASLVTLPPPLR